MTRETPTIPCAESGCPASIRDHAYGRVKAAKEGWLFQLGDGPIWCPEHLPEWAVQFRQRRAEERSE